MPALDGSAERHAVHLGAVDRGVVHRVQVEAGGGLLDAASGRLGVHTRSCRHVEPLGCPHRVGVVDERVRGDGALGRLGGLRGCGVLDACGAMRLVAEHQIELGCYTEGAALGLRVSDEAERLVGAEHNRHRLGLRHSELFRDPLGIGRDRHRRLNQRSVLRCVPGASVGAHPDIAVRNAGVALPGPFPHGLIHQRNGRHQIQHPPACAGEPLRDPQRHHRLAGAARQHESSAVVLLESLQDLGDGLPLERLRGVPRPGSETHPGGIVETLDPVDRPGLEVAAVQHLAARDGLLDHRPRLRGHRRGEDQQPRGERRAGGRGDERVNRRLVDPPADVCGGLDRAQTPAHIDGLLGHQVDTDIAPVAVSLAVGPLHPPPDLLEALRAVQVGMAPERLLHQPFERSPTILGRIETLVQQVQHTEGG